MISSIINKQFSDYDSCLNVLWTPCDYQIFKTFIKESCQPCNLLDFDSTYYGFNDISVILCNNRITHLDKCLELAYFLHCPLLVVDHDKKPSAISNKTENIFSIYPVHQIAINTTVYLSWDKIHDSIQTYDIQDPKTKTSWKNLIFQISKIPMIIKNSEVLYETTQTQKNICSL